MPTRIRQDQLQTSFAVNDKLAAGVALQTSAQMGEDDFNAARSQINRVIDSSLAGHFYDDLSVTQRGVKLGLKQAVGLFDSIFGKVICKGVSTFAKITVPSGQNFVILSAANGETPSLPAAITASSIGAVCAVSASAGAAFQGNELTVSPGDDVFAPRNLCRVYNYDNGEVVEGSNNLNDVYALLQVESTGQDNKAFNDTASGERVKLSFVVRDYQNNALVAASPADIGGKAVRFLYTQQIAFQDSSAQLFSSSATADLIGSVDITLSRAVVNQAGLPIPVQASVLWQVANGQLFKIQNAAGTKDLFSIQPTSSGNLGSIATDSFNFATTTPVTSATGLQVATGSQTLNLGVVPGQVDSASLTLNATGSSNLALKAGQSITFLDGYAASSQYGGAIALASNTAEYNTFKSTFGAVSILQGIELAAQQARHRSQVAFVVGNLITAGTVLTGVGSSANLTKALPDISMISDTQTNVQVVLNGVALIQGTSSATVGADYYLGPNRQNGEIIFTAEVLRGNLAPGTTDWVRMDVFGTA